MLKKQHVNDIKFNDAEEIKNKIVKVKETLKMKKSKYLDIKYQNESRSIEEKAKKDLVDFDNELEEKLSEFQLNAKKLISDLNIRQNYEITELNKQLEMSMVKSMKYSNNFLDLKKQQENLIKQQFFKEAHVITKKLQIMEKSEIEASSKARNDKIKSKTDKLASKHVLEKNSLLKKIKDEEGSLNKQREDVHEMVSQKYRNKIIEINSQHHQEKLMNDNENLYKLKNAAQQSTKILSSPMISPAKKYFSPESARKRMKKLSSGFIGEQSIFLKTEGLISEK